MEFFVNVIFRQRIQSKRDAEVLGLSSLSYNVAVLPVFVFQQLSLQQQRTRERSIKKEERGDRERNGGLPSDGGFRTVAAAVDSAEKAPREKISSVSIPVRDMLHKQEILEKYQVADGSSIFDILERETVLLFC